MTAINEKAAGAEPEAAELENFDSHNSTLSNGFLEDSSQKSHTTKTLYDLEQECLGFMEKHSFHVDKLVIDDSWQRLSADGGSDCDEWYRATTGFSEKGNPWLMCTFGTFSGGHKTIGVYKSWETDDRFSQKERKEFQLLFNDWQKKGEQKRAEYEKERIKKAIKAWESASELPQSEAQKTYLSKKGVSAHGVRFGERAFKEGAKENRAFVKYPAVIIPLRDTLGNLFAVQAIREDGEKRFTGPKRGNFHTIGSITPDSRIFVAEGYATAASLFEAFGEPVIVAFDCGNLDPVVKNIRKEYPGSKIVVAGDDDVETAGNPGRTHAEAVAAKYQCQVVFPSFPSNFRLPDNARAADFNDLALHFGADKLREQLAEALNSSAPPPSPEEIKKALNDNECGDAALFKKQWGSDYLFYYNEKAFYVWNGSFWELDKTKTRHKKLELVACQYETEAERLSKESGDDDDKSAKAIIKELRGRARGLKTARRMSSVLEMATAGSVSSGAGLSFGGPWDDCVGYLPCANGLVDLKTGNLIEAGRKHYIRKSSSVKYDASAKCPMFEKFVFEIMGDQEVFSAFLKRLFGYIAIGRPIEHVYVFLYGALGRNGKGTLVRLISKALGHLARSFQSELLLLQRNPPSSGSARPDLINLEGTRFALFSEINKGRKLDSAILKNLSGGDKVVGRPLFGFEREFDPTHTLLFQANHKPQAPADDPALWRRAILLPFDVTFVDEPALPNERKIDTQLEAKLEAERPGILRWLVEGAYEYYRSGLQVPKEVRSLVEEYRSENDAIGSFLEDRCDIVSELSEPCSKLKEALKKYCEQEGLSAPNRNEITQALLSKGFQKHRDRMGERWCGISLKKPQAEEGSQC